jgi:hypothetical protein
LLFHGNGKKGIKDHTILFSRKDDIIRVTVSKTNTSAGDVFSKAEGRRIAYERLNKYIDKLDNTDKDLTSVFCYANEHADDESEKVSLYEDQLKSGNAVPASIIDSVALFMRRADRYFKDHEGFLFI